MGYLEKSLKCDGFAASSVPFLAIQKFFPTASNEPIDGDVSNH
jgi:hypothetical protein